VEAITKRDVSDDGKNSKMALMKRDQSASPDACLMPPLYLVHLLRDVLANGPKFVAQFLTRAILCLMYFQTVKVCGAIFDACNIVCHILTNGPKFDAQFLTHNIACYVLTNGPKFVCYVFCKNL
jgi:hypothetical protein